jgi:AraC-like DNA-binding protein
MKWITRERPKIDRIACPWLIKRFIDPQAEILFVPFAEVLAKAQTEGATPFDIPEAEFTHYEDRCTFDYFLEKYDLKDPALHILAPIVRGADTDDHSIAVQSAGLWAISAGLSFNIPDDHELLEKGMLIYDALYSWAKHLQNEKHTQNPTEKLLLQVFNTYINQKASAKSKIPVWAKELKEIIQDQIDTNLSLSLKEISEGLALNPAYVSREFSKYFDNLSYGEYIRKLRIEKSIELLHTDQSLSEIAYLTGFSDQSHFTRIFKKYTGKNPSDYRKSLSKSKKDTKG